MPVKDWIQCQEQRVTTEQSFHQTGYMTLVLTHCPSLMFKARNRVENDLLFLLTGGAVPVSVRRASDASSSASFHHHRLPSPTLLQSAEGADKQFTVHANNSSLSSLVV